MNEEEAKKDLIVALAREMRMQRLERFTAGLAAQFIMVRTQVDLLSGYEPEEVYERCLGALESINRNDEIGPLISPEEMEHIKLRIRHSAGMKLE